MLTFHESMDPHSLDMRKDGEQIGFLQWHSGLFETVFWSEPGLRLYMSDWKQIQDKADEIRERIRQWLDISFTRVGTSTLVTPMIPAPWQR